MKKINYNYISILITYILVITVIILYMVILHKYIIIPGCLIYEHFGIYCPACGSTRAVIALSNLHILDSILYNPIILYTLVVSTLYLCIGTINIVLKKNILIKWKFFIYVGVVLGLVNWILQNILIRL